ncbi:MFS transporter [Nonomuraea sp. NPDC049709]|uniref:MFS transporter n=1 Tax=Nonomuraea sp. NPDC049709 TaxID=3154736 RepID=UPI00343119E8
MSSSTETAAPELEGGGSPRSVHGWRIVAALAVTQTIGYGVLYYAFSVFLTPMARDLHATDAQIAAALTLSVLIAAVCAPLVGRRLDARGGRALMTAGSLLGTAAVLAWSRVESLPQLYAVFAAIGIACSMVLYEAAFAVIVAIHAGNERGRATGLLALTIVAGFASSIFLPLTGLLVEHYGWRTALVILALIYGVAAIPLHALAVRRHPAKGRAQASAAAEERAGIVKAATRRRPFWLLVIAFTANGGAVAVIAVLLITYLVHLGHSPVLAATLAGLLGVLSVTGRLITTGLQTRLPAALIAAAIFALQGVAVLLLPLVGHGAAGAIGAVLLFGLGFGIASITLPHLLVERYGTVPYAGLAGRIAAFSVADKALAPLGAVALAQAAGYGWVMGAVAAACGIAACALVAYHRV